MGSRQAAIRLQWRQSKLGCGIEKVSVWAQAVDGFGIPKTLTFLGSRQTAIGPRWRPSKLGCGIEKVSV